MDQQTFELLEFDSIRQLVGRYAATTLEDLRRVHRTLPATFLARTVSEVTPYVLDGLYRELTA